MIRRVRITNLGFLLAGITLIVFGVLLGLFGLNKYKKINTYTKSTGIITRIDEEETTDANGETETSHTVYVKHTVDGKEYEGQFDEYNSSFSEGTEVDLAYNPKDPSDFVSTSTGILKVLLVGSPVMILVGLLCFIIFVVRKKKGLL